MHLIYIYFVYCFLIYYRRSDIANMTSELITQKVKDKYGREKRKECEARRQFWMKVIIMNNALNKLTRKLNQNLTDHRLALEKRKYGLIILRFFYGCRQVRLKIIFFKLIRVNQVPKALRKFVSIRTFKYFEFI